MHGSPIGELVWIALWLAVIVTGYFFVSFNLRYYAKTRALIERAENCKDE